MSFQNPATQTFTSTQRASLAANITNQQIHQHRFSRQTLPCKTSHPINTYFLLDSYLTNTHQQNNDQLRDFSIQYIANQSNSSVAFVTAAYNLGKTPSTACVSLLSGQRNLELPKLRHGQLHSTLQQHLLQPNQKLYSKTSMNPHTTTTPHIAKLLQRFLVQQSPKLPSLPNCVDKPNCLRSRRRRKRQFIPEYLERRRRLRHPNCLHPSNSKIT